MHSWDAMRSGANSQQIDLLEIRFGGFTNDLCAQQTVISTACQSNSLLCAFRFDGVSATTQDLRNTEAVIQTGLWFVFCCCSLPCCVLCYLVVDLRMKAEQRVCCF